MGLAQRPEGGDARLVEGDEILDLYPYAVAHEGFFGEVRGEGGYATTVTTVEGREGVEGGEVHGLRRKGKPGAWRFGGKWVCRRPGV